MSPTLCSRFSGGHDVFLYERASRKDRKKRSHVCGWTHGKLSPHCAHTASSHQAAERRLNGLSGDYTQINQSTVTLHHIGAVCVTQSAAAVICETCCMYPTGPPKVPCDGVRKHGSPLFSPFFFFFSSNVIFSLFLLGMLVHITSIHFR